MTPFELIRAQAAPALTAPCLVAPDRTGRSFLVSDFPARYTAEDASQTIYALAQHGFACAIEGNVAYLDWQPQTCAAWLNAQPAAELPEPSGEMFQLWGICRTLLRHAPGDLALDPDMTVMRRVFHLSVQKDIPALARFLGEALAVSLRTHTAPPVAAARLLLLTDRMH